MDGFQAIDKMEIKVQHHKSLEKSSRTFLENRIKIKGRIVTKQLRRIYINGVRKEQYACSRLGGG